MIFTPVKLKSGKVTNRGLNWSLGKTDDGKRVVNHGGGGVGSNSAMIVYLDDKVVVAAQANMSQSDPGAVAEPIGELFRKAAQQVGGGGARRAGQ
jgi:hypothetical protein